MAGARVFYGGKGCEPRPIFAEVVGLPRDEIAEPGRAKRRVPLNSRRQVLTALKDNARALLQKARSPAQAESASKVLVSLFNLMPPEVQADLGDVGELAEVRREQAAALRAADEEDEKNWGAYRKWVIEALQAARRGEPLPSEPLFHRPLGLLRRGVPRPVEEAEVGT